MNSDDIDRSYRDMLIDAVICYHVHILFKLGLYFNYEQLTKLTEN